MFLLLFTSRGLKMAICPIIAETAFEPLIRLDLSLVKVPPPSPIYIYAVLSPFLPAMVNKIILPSLHYLYRYLCPVPGTCEYVRLRGG